MSKKYQIIYVLSIVVLGIIAVAVIWSFTNNFWGVAALVFGFWNWSCYEELKYENCIEEQKSFKYVFLHILKSWLWFAVLVTVAYFLFKAYIPEIFN